MRPAFPDGGSWWRAGGVPRDQTEGLAPILFLDEARHEGANPAALDRLQKNALIYAAGEGRTGGVTLLLANGIDPNAVYHNNLTALMWAAGFGKTDTVRALLAAGANPQLKDNRSKTAADIAREHNFAETAQLLDGASTGG